MRERRKKRLIDWSDQQPLNPAELGNADETLQNFAHLVRIATTRGELLHLRSCLFRSEMAHSICGDPLDPERFGDVLSSITHRIAALANEEERT